MFSALPSNSDIARRSRHVSNVPIAAIGVLLVNLSPCHRKVVLHWGEMGTRWGMSRTVAQIHALLYSRSAR
jgi:hypothetical protein